MIFIRGPIDSWTMRGVAAALAQRVESVADDAGVGAGPSHWYEKGLANILKAARFEETRAAEERDR